MERVFLNRYQAIRQLGEGGMGRVYLAKQLDLGRQVVVKVMHEHICSDPKFRDRFESETLLMARFQHPFAVTLYDASLDDPQGPCIVMEYVKGITLDQLVEQNKGRLSPGRVGRLLSQLCEVLQAAHNDGVIHRDLKPANLMVIEPDTPYEKIKVMDFGLAKIIDTGSQRAGDGSAPDMAVGTPAYICPEQVRGEAVDHRGDLYSVGVMLYELLTGKLPFNGPVPLDIMMMHTTEAPPSFAEAGAKGVVPSAVERLVLACLEKDPAKRPQSARDLAERFQEALAELTPAPKKAPPITPPDSGPAPLDFDKKVIDPHALAFHMEAWMPEEIAEFKLRGFVQDAGGKVLDSVPGLIRVQLGGPGTPYEVKAGLLTVIGLGRKAGLIEMYLRLLPTDPKRKNQLHVTVLMRSLAGVPRDQELWRARCTQIYSDLRGYLMGQDLEEVISN